jgi:DMSO/TMAO reductase YedYZ molybdopterin-dependent catalytic subunit
MALFNNKPADAPETNRYGKEKLPPGQLFTEKFPVMTYGPTPVIEKEEWSLTAQGLVSEEISLNWNDLRELPQTELNADFHCVTHWSRFDDVWKGVLFRDYYESIASKVEESAAFVIQHAYGGYTTNLPLDWMLEEDVLIAHTFNGEPLTVEHGGPVRVFTPKRYGWKGAKWIRTFEFMKDDKPGFWEKNGYSNTANPWNEERYW